ncbi:MAG: 50S ribosomal protein L6 [Planctomycetota bacterium]|jgi:large subunit ribosomal protein L6|nr:50S ribosomal protein L6 [Planctomycetota bacterium]
MSRIGNTPVPVPNGVTVEVASNEVKVQGPKGDLQFPLFPEVTAEVVDNNVVVKATGVGAPKKASALHGLVRAHIANMVEGVTTGYKKELEIQGVGWNCKMAGSDLELSVGFCHTVKVTPPAGVSVELKSPTEITITGIDKQAVGQYAANVRRVRPPEPYKGKGIRYIDEHVRRKSGKSLA